MAKILIVGDEPLNVKSLATNLPPEQYDTIQAYDGLQALEKATGESPDLILLDVMTPGMDGYEVTKRLKNNPCTSDIPIILLTASGETEHKVKGLAEGADELLNKPVDNAELMVRVENLLRLKHYQEQLKARAQSQESFLIPGSDGAVTQEIEELPVVLLVEDDERDVRLISDYLRGQPYHLKVTRNGEETVCLVERERVDVVLLDILLRDMDGFEVCRRLKEMDQTKNIQIVFITCLTDLESKLKGIELGADDFLVKPINMQELRVRISALLKKKADMDTLSANYQTALSAAIVDELTGIYNNSYLRHFLKLEVKRSHRYGHFMALTMIDIDDFKHYNDTLGHLAGDQILRKLGKLLKGGIREVDLAARYGGDEFALIFPYTDGNEAQHAAERLRLLIHDHPFTGNTSSVNSKLSVSMGIAVCPKDSTDAHGLIHKADKALYKAKKEGKNRVCVYENTLA